MTFGFDVVEGVLELAVLINHEGRANGAHVGLAIHALLTIGTVLKLNFVIWVTE